jgi:hypothetical protein
MHKLALLLLIPVGYSTCNERKTNSPDTKKQTEERVRSKELSVNRIMSCALVKQSANYYHQLTTHYFAL